MIETASLYFYYQNYNVYGINSIGAAVWSIIAGVFKKTLSRILVLTVSLGYGITRSSIDQSKAKVWCLGFCYFVLTLILGIMESVTSTLTFAIVFFLLLPVAVVDSIFYWWIFLSLWRTMNQLNLRRQTEKLKMYKRLAITLLFSMVVSGIFAFSQLFGSSTATRDVNWASEWTYTGYWHTLYFIILLVIVIIWRPTKNNARYALEELPSDEPMTQISVLPDATFQEVKQRSGVQNVENSKPQSTDNVIAFSITDEEPTKLD